MPVILLHPLEQRGEGGRQTFQDLHREGARKVVVRRFWPGHIRCHHAKEPFAQEKDEGRRTAHHARADETSVGPVMVLSACRQKPTGMEGDACRREGSPRHTGTPALLRNPLHNILGFPYDDFNLYPYGSPAPTL